MVLPSFQCGVGSSKINCVQEMSSYLPIRHNSAARTDHDIHAVDNASYMEHFLNIPDICPTGSDYRSSRYYMGQYPTDACRMEALQQRNHDFRMGLHGRSSFYPNMNVAANLQRFRDNMETFQGNANKNEPISPGTGSGLTSGDGEAQPYYPWMSIVGKCIFIDHIAHKHSSLKGVQLNQCLPTAY